MRGCCTIGGGGGVKILILFYSTLGVQRRGAFRHFGVWCFHLLHEGFTNLVMCVFVCAKYRCSCPYAVNLKTNVT
jgi:hypothetical protein